MISNKLKEAWRDRAHTILIDERGEDRAPAKGSVSNYIGRILKGKNILDHVSDENIFNNSFKDAIVSVTQGDIRENRPSTGVTAQAVQKGYLDLREQQPELKK